MHFANVSIANCLPTLTPPSVGVADFVISWIGTGALPHLSPWPNVICSESCRGHVTVSLLDLGLTHSPGQRVNP
jgi:hypothetical protein